MSDCEICDCHMTDAEARDWLICPRCRRKRSTYEELQPYCLTPSAIRHYLKVRAAALSAQRARQRRQLETAIRKAMGTECSDENNGISIDDDPTDR